MSRDVIRKIYRTTNYRLFQRSDENRPTDMKKHRRLLISMTKYGWIPSFPMVCRRDAENRLIVRDGQHRLVLAEKLGLSVHWVLEPIEFDIAVINCGAKPWVLRDYAEKYAANGVEPYRRGLDFAQQHKLPIGKAFALLGGTTTFNNVEPEFTDGTFKVKDQGWADAVAGLYSQMATLSPMLRNESFLAGCMAVCRVQEFDVGRLLRNAARCREKLVSYSTRDAYLDMLEAVYNWGRAKLFGLKTAAINAMRERNAAKAGPRKQNGQVKQQELKVVGESLAGQPTNGNGSGGDGKGIAEEAIQSHVSQSGRV